MTTSSHTDLIGTRVLISEAMNQGLHGVIRHVRTLPNGFVFFLVQMLDGAAEGTLIDLNIGQFRIERTRGT